jgi:hypothetical protein
VQNGSIYDYSGRHIGWLQDGWIRDRDGNAVLFSAEAMGGPLKPLRQLPGLKGLQGLRPLKGGPELPPKPIFSLNWSEHIWGNL